MVKRVNYVNFLAPARWVIYVITCPNCGAENEDSAQSCVQCQAAFGEQAPATEAPATPPPTAPAPAAPPPAAPYGAPPPQQPYQQYPGYGPQPVRMGPVIPPGVITGMVLAIVGLVLVLVGLSIDIYVGGGNAWDIIGFDAQFAYIVVVPIFAILAMVFATIIFWVRQRAFLHIILATGILGIILPILLWLHGYIYFAVTYDVGIGDAMAAMGVGFGWIIALVGGIMFVVAAQMIKKDLIFPPKAQVAQPGYYQQPQQQPAYQQPPQQPPQPPPGTP